MTRLIEVANLGWVQPSEVRRVQIEVQQYGKTYVLVINGDKWKSSNDLAELQILESEIVAKVNGTATYAVIYDSRDPMTGDDLEEYFETFTSPDEARRQFHDLAAGAPHIHNARLVQIIERLSDQRP